MAGLSQAEQFNISIGDSVSDGVPAVGAGIIAVSTEHDVYTVEATAGQLVFLEELSVAASFQGWLYWDLKAPSGLSLMSAYFDGTHEGRRVLSETGIYTLRVRLLANDAGYVGAYSFRLRGIAPDQVFAIQLGDLVTTNAPGPGAGNIEVAGANDVYEFEANAGDNAFFEEISVAAAFAGWLQWELKTPGGQSLFRSFFGGTHEGRWTLPQTGKYTLRFGVSASNPAYVGQYAFRIRGIPPDPTFGIEIGQVVTNGVPGSGAGNIEVPGAQDYYTFEGQAGQSLFFENLSAAASLGGWLQWEVKAPSGQKLFTAFMGTSVAGRKTLPETGTYTIRCWVGASNPAYVGSYSFRVMNIEDSSFAVGIGDLVSDGVPGLGAGRIDTAGGQDLYTFTGMAGQHVIVEELAASTAFGGWLKLEVRTPGSNVVWGGWFQAGRRQQMTLPESGEYRLRVFVANSNPGYVGTYSFRTYCEVYAGRDTVAVLPGGTLAIPKSKLLCNDLSEPMDALSIDLPAAGTSGAGSVVDTNGFVIYAAAPGFVGEDWFEYRLRGALGGEATGQVKVLVAPDADQHATVVSCNRVSATVVSVCLLGAAGQSYVVEQSGDLESWLAVQNLVADSHGSMNWSYSTTGSEKMFYRFRRAP